MYGLAIGDLDVTQGAVDPEAYLDVIETRKRTERLQSRIEDFFLARKTEL